MKIVLRWQALHLLLKAESRRADRLPARQTFVVVASNPAILREAELQPQITLRGVRASLEHRNQFALL